MKIAMIGTGYVGLVSGVCFSDFGHDVICVDKDPSKIELLRNGEVPIYEPGLDQLMALALPFAWVLEQARVQPQSPALAVLRVPVLVREMVSVV